MEKFGRFDGVIVDELGRTLIALPPTTAGEERRTAIVDLTTRTYCPAFNNWVRKASPYGTEWTDNVTWELVEQVLRTDSDDLLLIACRHLLALGGPYRPETTPPVKDSVPLAMLIKEKKGRTVPADEVHALYERDSVLRRQFAVQLTNAALSRDDDSQILRERRQHGKAIGLALPLRRAAVALATAVADRIDEMDRADWDAIVVVASMRPDPTPRTDLPNHEGKNVERLKTTLVPAGIAGQIAAALRRSRGNGGEQRVDRVLTERVDDIAGRLEILKRVVMRAVEQPDRLVDRLVIEYVFEAIPGARTAVASAASDDE